MPETADNTGRREGRTLAAALGLFLLVQAAFAVAYLRDPSLVRTPDDYVGVARLWSRTGLYPEPLFGPAYPAFCRLVLGIGLGERALALFNVAFTAVAALCAGAVARRLTGSARTGAVAAALALLWPTTLIYAPVIQTEPMYAALLGIAVLLTVQEAAAPFLPRALLAGLAFGVLALTRGNGLLAAALAAGVLAAHGRWRSCAALAVVVVAAAGAWTLHNGLAYGTARLTPAGDYNIAALMVGQARSAARGAPAQASLAIWRPELKAAGYSDAQIDRPDARLVFPLSAAAKRVALRWALAHPLETGKAIAVGQGKAWAGAGQALWTRYLGDRPAPLAALSALCVGLTVLAGAGLAAMVRSGQAVRPLFLVGLIAAHVLPAGAGAYSRFVFPVIGLAAVFAAAALTRSRPA